MNRIDSAFARLKAARKKAFIPYIAAGVPGSDETVEIVLELERLGADIVELGYPFSDPMADGVVNQAAATRALELGVDADAYFSIVEKIRKRSQIPMVVFGYLNPIFKQGLDAFARRAKIAGMDGMLIVDMPVEETFDLQAICKREDLSLIFLVAPTTTPERLGKVLEGSSGFLYYVSRTGITGEQATFPEDFAAKVTAIKRGCRLPVIVGFGISTPDHVRTVCGLADGVAVGSALVRRTLGKKPFPEMLTDIRTLVASLAAPTKEIWN